MEQPQLNQRSNVAYDNEVTYFEGENLDEALFDDEIIKANTIRFFDQKSLG